MTTICRISDDVKYNPNLIHENTDHFVAHRNLVVLAPPRLTRHPRPAFFLLLFVRWSCLAPLWLHQMRMYGASQLLLPHLHAPPQQCKYIGILQTRRDHISHLRPQSFVIPELQIPVPVIASPRHVQHI